MSFEGSKESKSKKKFPSILQKSDYIPTCSYTVCFPPLSMLMCHTVAANFYIYNFTSTLLLTCFDVTTLQ